MEEKLKIAIFDLDNTLININTTIEFVRYYLRSFNIFKYLIFLFYYYFLKDFLNLLPKHNIRKTIIFFLKGAKRKDLEKLANNFTRDFKDKLNPEVLNLLDKYKNNNYLVFIVSSSIDLLAKSFSNVLSLKDGYGSSLEFIEERCSGRLSKDLLGNKLSFLKQLDYFNKIDFINSSCISDNKEDLDLLKLFGQSLAVVYQRVGAIFFEKNNIKYKFIAPFLPLTKKNFILPLSYFFYTRTNSLFITIFVINSQIIFHFITLYFFYHFLNLNLIISYFLALLGFYSIYEIFYILNDCQAFREKYPTLRISKEICKDKNYIISYRLVAFAIIIFLLFYILKYNISFYIFAIIVLAVVYTLHNQLEISKLKQYLSIPLLFLSHLIIPLSIFSVNKLYIFFVFLLYGFIIAKTLNFLAKQYEGENQYYYRFVNIDCFHYLILLVVVLLRLINPYELFWQYSILIGIYFVLYDSLFTLRHLPSIISRIKKFYD